MGRSATFALLMVAIAPARDARADDDLADLPLEELLRVEVITASAASGDGLVRQDVFPAPRSLSAEDHLLLFYLKRTPQDEILANSVPPELPLDLRNELKSDPLPGPTKQEVSNTK